MFREIIKWITPHETQEIVNELFNDANQIREVKLDLKSSADQLSVSWQGGQTREEILNAINEDIENLEGVASELESKAREISKITVFIIIIEYIQDAFGVNN